MAGGAGSVCSGCKGGDAGSNVHGTREVRDAPLMMTGQCSRLRSQYPVPSERMQAWYACLPYMLYTALYEV